MRRFTRHLAIILLAAATTGPATAQRTDLSGYVRQFVDVDTTIVAITGVKIIDGTGAPSASGQTIVLDGSHISAVGPTNQIDIPANAQVLDLQGHTVIPGLVGLHNHTFYTTRQRRVQLSTSAPILYLASGVTTIRTTGSYAPYSEINLKRSIERGEMVGPRMFITGPYITGGEGMTYMTRLSGPEDARRVVRYWAEEGVDWFKAYNQITRDELGAAIEEAHEHGLKVTGHLCSVSYMEAVALGIDNLEHGLFANSDYDEDRPPDECPNDYRNSLLEVDFDGDEVRQTFTAMIENDVPMTSTLAVYELIVPDRPPIEQRVLEAMAPAARQEYLDERKSISESGGDFWSRLFARAQEYEYRFVEAGGTLASGVDPTGIGGALPGFGDQRNYELLIEAGFEPVAVIQIMSANGAKVLGIDDEIGTIEAGKVADLVVIDGDPETTHAEIRNVVLVFKEGVGYDAAKLIEEVRGLVGIE